MKTVKIRLMLMTVVSFSLTTWSQGTFQITFDGVPLQPPLTLYYVQNYYESGMRFWSPTGEGFARSGPNWDSTRRPNNGTAYLAGTLPFSLTINSISGSLFGVSSVELAGYSSGVPNVTSYFTGYQSDGGMVSTNFAARGLAFHTYYFGKEFNNLTHIEVLDFGSLDNLVAFIPEPGTGAWVLMGTAALSLRLIRKRRHNP